MKSVIAESERLILRILTLEDSDFILELLNTEGWIKYIGERNVKTTRQAIDYLKNGPLKSYENNGFGLYLVTLKDTGKAIGMCGFIKRDYLDHIDIGFAFLPDYIGKGYAYEIAKETLRYGFDELQKDKVLAICLPSNASSIKLLEKMSFKLNKMILTNDTHEELSLYALNKEDFH